MNKHFSHGHNARNYELTMIASRHYWNTIMPLVSQPIERELLKQPLRIILESIADIAADKDKKTTKTTGDAITEQKVTQVNVNFR